MAITLGYGLAALVALAVIAIGARFLFSPYAAADAFGVPVDPDAHWSAYLSAKGVRDIASGLFVALLIANGRPHLLAFFLVAAALIPFVDMLIVLRCGGARVTALAVHGGTAAFLLATGALLYFG